jgi:hypothetical protein
LQLCIHHASVSLCTTPTCFASEYILHIYIVIVKHFIFPFDCYIMTRFFSPWTAGVWLVEASHIIMLTWTCLMYSSSMVTVHGANVHVTHVQHPSQDACYTCPLLGNNQVHATSLGTSCGKRVMLLPPVATNK